MNNVKRNRNVKVEHENVQCTECGKEFTQKRNDVFVCTNCRKFKKAKYDKEYNEMMRQARKFMRDNK